MPGGRLRLALGRLGAGAIDTAAAVAIATACAYSSVGTFFARRAVVMLHIGQPATIWKGPIPMLMGIAGTFVYSLPFAFVCVALVPALRGVSLGEALVRLDPPLENTNKTRARWRRAALRSVPWWGLLLALLAGSWQLAAIALLSAPVVWLQIL